MIYGIGTDLCDVGRIEKSIARPAFLQHVYTPAEQELIVAHTGKKQAETAAANFAAKEAFLKACGTGLSGFSMAEIAALRQPSGAPYLEFTGKAARFMAQNHWCWNGWSDTWFAASSKARQSNGNLADCSKRCKSFVGDDACCPACWAYGNHLHSPPDRIAMLFCPTDS